MRIRIIWILANDDRGWNIVYFRRFSNVENHARRLQHQQYVPVPDNCVMLKQIVEKLRLQQGFMKYVDSRDSCNKECLAPVYNVPIAKNSSISLPVVILPKKNAVLCCLPLFEESETNLLLASSPVTAVALNLLLSIVECLNPFPDILTQDHSKLPQLDNFISQCMPLGRLIDTSFPVTNDKLQNKPLAVVPNSKQPAWKPIHFKGKGLVSLAMTEYVRSHQFDRPEKKDVLAVYGSVLCGAKIEGSSPELLLTISNENPKNKLCICDLSVDPCVSSVEPSEHKNGVANLPYCKLRCMPPLHDFKLCNYVIPTEISRPPVLGALKLRGQSTGDLLLQLKLDESVKNSFEYFDVTIPFLERELITKADLKPTWGMANITPDRRAIFWNLGTKFPSKTLQVSLSASINFGTSKKLDSGLSSSIDDSNTDQIFAQVQFCVKSFLLSSSNIVSSSVYTAPSTKFNLSFEKELLATDYKIWNSCSGSPTPTQQWIKYSK